MPEAWNELYVWSDAERTHEKLVTDWITSGWTSIPSQRVFRASIPGDALGYVKPDSGTLRIRGSDGRERSIDGVRDHDWRLSPDGRHVAAVTGEGNTLSLALLEVETGEQRVLGELFMPDRIEWTRDGIVAREWGKDSRVLRLTYFPLDGEPRTLVERKEIGRFAAASRGSRVIFAVLGDESTTLYEVDTLREGKPVKLGKVRGAVLNAELTPDGARAAFATTRGVYQVGEAGDKPARLSSDEDVRTLWFSPDGARLAFATTKRATVLDGDRKLELTFEYNLIESARFAPGGADLLVSAGPHAYRWNPDGDRLDVIATAPDGHRIVAADLFGDEVVVWTQRSLW